MVNALFHKGEYLLLPQEFPTFSDFIADLRSREMPVTREFVRLKEENRITTSGKVVPGFCMAPCFLSGYRDWVIKVTIDDPADVYPVTAERIPLNEYNQRLREAIGRTCGGCLRCKPPTARDQTLGCYKDLLSIEGVCFFRYDEKPAPRSFGELLAFLGGGFMRLKYAEKDTEAMRLTLKESLHVLCDAAEKALQPDGTTLLTVTLKRKELLPPYLMLAAGHYLHSLTGTYRLQPSAQPDTSPDALLALIQQGEPFRKECRKYGVSLAVLTWDGRDNGRVADLLWQMNKTCLLYPLHTEPGRSLLLLMDTAVSLKQMRYHAPMLEAHAAQIDVYGPAHSRRYTVSFCMPYDPLD